MRYKLPNDTKDYLLFMIENRIENNPQDSVFKNKKCYEQLYILEQPENKNPKAPNETPEGGFGSGKPRKKKTELQPGFGEIMMGDAREDSSDDEEVEDSNPLLKLVGAGTAAGIGALAGGVLGKAASSIVGKAGPLGKYGAKALSSLGKQAEEISGKTWIEAQLGKIGQSQMELAAQGAGSPWTKFVIPEKKPTKILSPEQKAKEAYNAETQDLASRMKGEEIRNRARQQGLIP
jgi:hypothetical protein